MSVLAGHVWGPDGFFEGWLRVADGRIAKVGRGTPPVAADHQGVLVPRPLNAHTHVADVVARDRVPPGATLAELVAPPRGLKHRVLATTEPAALVAGMRGAIKEHLATGARGLVDFREGGAAGARLLREAARGLAADVRILARAPPDVEPGDAGALREALAEADGLALSALRDVAPHVPAAMADAAHHAGKIFALHFSEAERESVDAALALKPAFVVHASHATRADFARLAEADVPLVVCPRSNVRLARLADVVDARKAGVRVLVGSDNAMLQSLSVWDELRALLAAQPQLQAKEVLALAFDARPFAGLAVEPLVEEAHANVVVLTRRGTDPMRAVFDDAPLVQAVVAS